MEHRLHATAALCGEGAEWGPGEGLGSLGAGQACIMGLRESTVEGGVGGCALWSRPLAQPEG